MATDTECRTGIPRMRTAAKIVAEIKAADPDTEVTESVSYTHLTLPTKQGV